MSAAASHLEVSREYVWKLIETGKLRAFRRGGQYWLSARVIEKLQKRRGVIKMPRRSYAQVVDELQDSEQAIDDVADILTDGSLDESAQLDAIADVVGVDTEGEEEGEEED